jgi:hypothetical protein
MGVEALGGSKVDDMHQIAKLVQAYAQVLRCNAAMGTRLGMHILDPRKGLIGDEEDHKG